MNIEQHVDDSLTKIRSIFVKACARIEALKPGEKIPATKLAEELASEIGMSGASLYPSLKFLFDGYPGVKVLRGAHGGIVRLPVDPQKPEVTEDKSQE
jgi:hypothetical protein